MVFCGNLQYRPNIDASRYLVEDIMPIVWQTHPEARLLIAGATPKGVVRQLASSRVTVSGSVEDIRSCYASAHVFVAPMRIGSGLQNKILEAMSMGIPCVSTSIVNASIAAQNGVQMLVADEPQSIAASIVQLLDNEELRQEMAAKAQSFVREKYSWQMAVKKLEEVLEQVISSHAKYEEERLEEE